MKKGSIENIIGTFANRLGRIHPYDAFRAADTKAADEVDAFASVDPILQALHKEYLEAIRSYKKLVKENGATDPMTEVAEDFLDSARGAVQTRLMELQEFREEEMREEVKRLIKRRQAENEAAHARAYYEKRQREKGDDLFFWFVMLFWLVNKTFTVARKKLSAANDFAIVSVSTPVSHRFRSVA